MKAKRISALIAFSLLTLSLVAFAQQAATVGELLDKGGKKLTKDELAKLVTGATIAGLAQSDPNYRSENTYKDDGSMSGHAFRVSGGTYTTGVFGTWSLNDQGQLCVVFKTNWGWGSQVCNFYFSLGTAYYVAPTDDRMAQLVVREVKR